MRIVRTLGLTAVAAAISSAPAQAVPFLGAETPRGAGTTTALDAVAPTPKTIDGNVGDWTGNSTGFGGSIVRSRGELIYTDHLFDAFGADDGADRDRLALTDPLTSTVPESYRLASAILEVDPAGEFGVPVPERLRYSTNYGNLVMQDVADLVELRLAADAESLHLLARTTTMKSAGDTAVLLLLDTEEGGSDRPVGYGTGLKTGAEFAAILSSSRSEVRNLRSGEVTAVPSAINPDGYVNAVEASIPRAVVGDAVKIAAASGRAGGEGFANVANVAFRTDEPVREWFDKKQALALLERSVDAFATTVDLADLAGGVTERWTPGAGYHDRIFRSTEDISTEGGSNGIWQHYGAFVPTGYDGSKETPMQLWLHWRGGNAHTAGHVIPGMFEDLGESKATLVISPRGRGSSSWYVGRGQVDFEQVWSDSHRIFSIDEQRTYSAGHSMGGFGTFLMTTLHPDRFAAGLPASPPVTQGAWTGADFEDCDEYAFDDYSFCYLQANGGDARAQHTRKLLDNLRHTPLAIYAGVADELVPISGVARQAERLIDLGYRHRFYALVTQEHYGPPVWDEWESAADYMHRFTSPENPSRVTYVRDMPFERATERVYSGGVPLSFSFDHAWWMSGLEPVDAENGRARFDGRSLAIAEADPLVVPEAGTTGPDGQIGPYVMAGIQWLDNPLGTLPAASNGFDITLTGARAVTLDGGRMGIDAARKVTGAVGADAPLRLTVTGAWVSPKVTVDGAEVTAVRDGRRLSFDVPAGQHTVEITPAARGLLRR